MGGSARFFAAVGAVLVLSAACRSGEDTGSLREDGTRTVAEKFIAQPEFFTGADLPDKTLILTFDDGPSPIDVATELSTWLKNRPTPIHATFFLNGACVAPTDLPNNSCDPPTDNAVSVIQTEIANGHLIGNHTTTHRDQTLLDPQDVVADISETDRDIGSFIPYNRMLFRAPYGNWNDDVFNAVQASPMNKYIGPIYWTIGGGPTDNDRAADWECWQDGYNTRRCGNLYLKEIHALAKGIILMHDRYGDTSNHDLDQGTGNSVDMVKYIIPQLEAEGFTFKATWEDRQIAAALPKCAGGCDTCSGPAANQCTSCPAGTTLVAGACLPGGPGLGPDGGPLSCPGGTQLVDGKCATTGAPAATGPNSVSGPSSSLPGGGSGGADGGANGNGAPAKGGCSSSPSPSGPGEPGAWLALGLLSLVFSRTSRNSRTRKSSSRS